MADLSAAFKTRERVRKRDATETPTLKIKKSWWQGLQGEKILGRQCGARPKGTARGADPGTTAPPPKLPLESSRGLPHDRIRKCGSNPSCAGEGSIVW